MLKRKRRGAHAVAHIDSGGRLRGSVMLGRLRRVLLPSASLRRVRWQAQWLADDVEAVPATRSLLRSELEVEGEWDPSDDIVVNRALMSEVEVRVFWDLDNVHPDDDSLSTLTDYVKPFKDFGRAVGVLNSVTAWANCHAFSLSPRERSEQRARADFIEWDMDDNVSGWDPSIQRFRCGVCGKKCDNREKLKKHMKMLHERERNKILNRVKCQKQQLTGEHKYRLAKYDRARMHVFKHPTRNELHQRLEEMGVDVQQVSTKREAADKALSTMARSLVATQTEQLFVIVSHDNDFCTLLRHLRDRSVSTAVATQEPLSEMSRLRDNCDFVWNLHTMKMWPQTARGRLIVQRWTSRSVYDQPGNAEPWGDVLSSESREPDLSWPLDQ
ncbi:C2H2-type domain-containing protein [Plasmodiophora brassicae]